MLVGCRSSGDAVEPTPVATMRIVTPTPIMIVVTATPDPTPTGVAEAEGAIFYGAYMANVDDAHAAVMDYAEIMELADFFNPAWQADLQAATDDITDAYENALRLDPTPLYQASYDYWITGLEMISDGAQMGTRGAAEFNVSLIEEGANLVFTGSDYIDKATAALPD